MAKDNIAKIKFTAETGEFNDAIKQANTSLSQLRAEMKLNEAEMKNNGASVEALEKQHDLLTQQLKAAEDKTQALSGKVEAAARIYGENSDEVAKLKTQLTNAKTAQEKLRGAVNDCNAQLEQQRSAASDAENGLDKLTDTIERQQTELQALKDDYVDAVIQYGKNSREAKALAGEIKDLSTELGKNEEELSKAEAAADKLDKSMGKAGDSAENSASGFTVAKGAIADLVSEAIQWGIDKVSEFVGWLGELPEATRELRQDMTTLETSFSTAGFTAEEASNTWKELYTVFGEDDRAVEAANLIAKMSDNQKDLDNWVTITTGVYGQFQDSLPVEGLAEASMETAKTGTVTGVLADALNWGAAEGEKFGLSLKKNIDFTALSNKELEKLTDAERAEYEARKAQHEAIDEYNTTLSTATSAEEVFNLALAECTTEQERQRLITGTLMGIYSGAASTYEEAAGSQLAAKEATAENTLAQADLGAAIEPVTTAWEGLKTELLVAVLPAVQAVSGVMLDALGWMKEHPDVVISIASALGAMGVALGIAAVAWGVYGIAQNWALIAPIALTLAIVAAIGAVVGAIVWCAQNWELVKAKATEVWGSIKATLSEWGAWISANVIEPVKTFFTGLWDGIKQAASGAWEGIKGFFQGAAEWFNNSVIQPIVQFFTGLWTSIVNIWNTICNAIQVAVMFIGSILSAAFQIITLPFMFIWENCKQYVFAAWEWIKNAVSTAINAVSSVISSVMNAISGVISTVWNAITTAVSAAVNAVKTVVTNVFNAIKSVVTTVWNAIKGVVTTVWDAIKSAVTAAVNAVKSKVTSVFNAVKTTVTNIWNGIKTTISNVWDNIKANVTNAVDGVKSTISNVFNNIKDDVAGVWDSIKSTITDKIDAAKDAVGKAIDKIKGFFDFEWSLPKLKMPHFSISGSFSLDPPSVPSFGIDWYAKAMDTPMILNGATIFGAANGKLLGGGETGREMIGGVDTVASMIQNAVDRSINALDLSALAAAVEDLANRPIELNINGRQFALATASAGDSVNGLRSVFKSRGLIVD